MSSEDDDFLDDFTLRNTHRRWEQSQKSWDTVFLKDGRLTSIMKGGITWENQYQAKKKLLKGKARALIRSLVIVIDITEIALAPLEFEVPRIRLIVEELTNFLTNFNDQNPLSQISIVTTSKYKGHIHTFLSCDIQEHLKALKKLSDIQTSGEPSLYNAIFVATNLLSTTPPYSTKEILVIYGSQNTCDPVPFDHLLEMVTTRENNGIVKPKYQINIINLGSELQFLKRLAQKTGGSCNVPIGRDHFANLLQALALPPAWNDNTQRRKFIPFGFPTLTQELPFFDLDKLMYPLAILDKNDDVKDLLPVFSNYCCPRCQAHILKWPAYCPCCSLLLMSPAQLSRSSHHLHPLDEFPVPSTAPDDSQTEDENENETQVVSMQSFVCSSCNSNIVDQFPHVCGGCQSPFCSACNKFIHDSLQQCPICLLSI